MIPQMEPWFTKEEADAVYKYMTAGGWLTEFRQTEAFEKVIADFTGARHCIVVNNGTISLSLAAMAAGIGPGDEVIVPDYTMIATPNSLRLFGAVPVFVDVELETLCLDLDLCEQALTDRTRALILVTANGRYPRTGIAAFEDFCKRHDLMLIEDSAQSLGCNFPDGRHMGRAGCIGSFSFSAPKVISTGQGGALITDKDELATALRQLKDFGRASGGNDIHPVMGWNFKFTDLQAVVGIEQMKKLDDRLQRTREMHQRYTDNLQDVPGVTLFDQDLEHTTPWFIDALVEDREALIDHLRANEIGSRVMYPPINRQEAYGINVNFPAAERVGAHGLWLPSAAQLSNDDIDRVCEVIRSGSKR
jgi:perosamine synthetase